MEDVEMSWRGNRARTISRDMGERSVALVERVPVHEREARTTCLPRHVTPNARFFDPLQATVTPPTPCTCTKYSVPEILANVPLSARCSLVGTGRWHRACVSTNFGSPIDPQTSPWMRLTGMTSPLSLRSLPTQATFVFGNISAFSIYVLLWYMNSSCARLAN